MEQLARTWASLASIARPSTLSERWSLFGQLAGSVTRCQQGWLLADGSSGVHLGRTVLEKYANTADRQQQARKAVEAVLDLAVKIQNKQLKEMKVSHAPGC